MIVVVLQYHAGDIREAGELASLIADIEPVRRADIGFRLVSRHDCPTMELPVLQKLGKKFDLSWARSESKESGWPKGPNGMALDILGKADDWMEECGWSDAVGILMLEPDCVPLQRDWLDQLIRAWDFALLDGVRQMGSWKPSGGANGHINGNCMLKPDLGNRVDLHMWCPPNLAWDVGIAPHLKKHWLPCGLFRNDFNSTNATEELLRTPEIGGVPPVIVHGYKDDSARRIARKWLKL